MNKVVNESLRKICHYQQNVPQHYYLLDTLVIKIRFWKLTERINEFNLNECLILFFIARLF